MRKRLWIVGLLASVMLVVIVDTVLGQVANQTGDRDGRASIGRPSNGTFSNGQMPPANGPG